MCVCVCVCVWVCVWVCVCVCVCGYECIYEYRFVWMYVLSYKTCHSGHCRNGFMATGALGHTHVRLHVVDFHVPKKAQLNNTATSIIIDTNIYIYIYI